MTLIQLQNEAVSAILALPEQGKRAAGYGHTFLNKSGRRLRGVWNSYRKEVSRLGYSDSQILLQIRDIKDMVLLEAAAD